MDPKKIKLFKNQPPLTDAHIKRLINAGLLVAHKSPRKRPNCDDEITNITAGEVVGNLGLSNKIRDGKITQDDARRLLAIESVRETGPPRHKSHISRLLLLAYAGDKEGVEKEIKRITKKVWGRKQK